MDTQEKRLYRYEILLQAIDFFSQRFHIEQLMEYGYTFTNKMFDLKSSALFIRKGDEFVLRKQDSYNLNYYCIPTSQQLDQLPLFHGHILTSNLETYFSKEVIDLFQIELVIPLIVDTELVGFIISNGNNGEPFNADDYAISHSLMKLINHSLENNQRFLDFQEINADLDRKIFNLFVMNQSTKALLSELELKNLYNIATDVFSEISGSKVTPFGIYDPITKKIKMSGYRNVSSFSGYYTELELMKRNYDRDNIVLHINRDEQTLKSIFKNFHELKRLEAEYIVLIVKDQILGVVTIGQSITGEDYGKSEFELIESLANATYVAITNAKLFSEISYQKKQIEKKYNVLLTLNKLVRNINSCHTKEELFELTLKTLSIGYGVKKALICEKSKRGNDYIVTHSLGLNHLIGFKYKVPSTIKFDVLEETFYDFKAENISHYFDDSFIEKLEEVSGIVISPITFRGGGQFETLGYLIVVETKDNLKEEEILVIDTMVQNITPIVYQMTQVEKIKENE